MYPTGQVSRSSADTAKTISGRRFTPTASSDWPHSTGSAIRLPAVSAAFSVQAGAPEKTANSSAAAGR